VVIQAPWGLRVYDGLRAYSVTEDQKGECTRCEKAQFLAMDFSHIKAVLRRRGVKVMLRFITGNDEKARIGVSGF
jgi:hypothetical protein